MNHPAPPFSLEESTLTLIPTDLAAPEAFIRKLADETQTAHPSSFAGNVPCVYYKLHYISPCENFHELRRLILRVQEHTGLRAKFHGIVALEVSEWLGHEKEEYFTSLLKYLFDHSDHWHSALVLKNCTEAKLERLQRNICFQVPGLEPRRSPQLLFSDPKRLEAYCREILRIANRSIAQKGLALLVDTLSRNELAEARSLALIDQTIHKLILSASDRKIISEVTVRQYLERPDTTLAMLLGAPAMGERNRILDESQL